MVFQRPVMLRRSVAANVDYALALRGLARATRRPLVDEALARAGLGDMAKRSARVLSAGEQQRLALARAWAVEPEVLFLDEPTANLDPAATRTVEEMITAIHEAGATIIMTTHDLGQAHRLADEILFLHRGRLMEHMAAAAFFAGPQSAEAKAFLTGDLLW
jgi:tungstate transport system ATP-binding protein